MGNEQRNSRTEGLNCCQLALARGGKSPGCCDGHAKSADEVSAGRTAPIVSGCIINAAHIAARTPIGAWAMALREGRGGASDGADTAVLFATPVAEVDS